MHRENMQTPCRKTGNRTQNLLAARQQNISSRLSVVFSRTLASAGKELKDNFLKALAEREEANRTGKMTVSTLLQHSNCYVMGFPSNISAIPLGWKQNPYCVKLSGNDPPPSSSPSPNTTKASWRPPFPTIRPPH
uniref:Uncharacterized protein n=1 Tax=Poecilia reticulata TaxID=8081 RepID=A0A3P9N4B8_POERE